MRLALGPTHHRARGASHLVARASCGEGGCTAEVRIPFTDLGRVPQPGEIWGVQVGRWRVVGGKEEISLWSAVPTEWHTKLWPPPTFGHLMFGPHDDIAAKASRVLAFRPAAPGAFRPRLPARVDAEGAALARCEASDPGFEGCHRRPLEAN